MENSRDNVALYLSRRQLDRIEDFLNANEEVLSHDGGGDGRPPMANTDERIGRIEGAIEGLKHSQNLMVITVLGIGAILAALGVYGLQRIRQSFGSSERAALPNQFGITRPNQDACRRDNCHQRKPIGDSADSLPSKALARGPVRAAASSR